MRKFWTIIFGIARITTIVMSFYVLLLPKQMVKIAIGNWQFYLSAAIVVMSVVSVYWSSYGLSTLARDLGLYRAFTMREAYRPVDLSLPKRSAILIIFVGVSSVLLDLCLGPYCDWLLPILYNVLILPVGVVNTICCLFIGLLFLRIELYLRSRRQDVCWYEYNIIYFCFEESVVLTAYGRCRASELDDTLAKIALENQTRVSGYVRRQLPELDRATIQRVTNKILAQVKAH